MRDRGSWVLHPSRESSKRNFAVESTYAFASADSRVREVYDCGGLVRLDSEGLSRDKSMEKYGVAHL
jgi:hypothetical protein